MKVSIHTKPINEIEVEIYCKVLNEEANQLYKQISSIKTEDISGLPEMIPGFAGNIMSLINPESIMLFFSSNKKVFAKTTFESYEVKFRLYEIEKMIENSKHNRFIRVSNTDIVNFEMVENLDLNLNGIVKINFKNGEKTFISRRYTKKVMEQLGVKTLRGKL